MLLFEKIEQQGIKLILASQSPRRHQLMEGSGLNCEIARFEVDESYPQELEASQVPAYLAQLKSDNYPHELCEGELLITADTVVICQGKILGKPKDEHDARAMLAAISGREHCVVTGVAIRSKDKSRCFACQSLVRFASLSSEEIDYYITRYKPFDKAGSYGIQEWIGYIGIESIEGSFYNVMGLPIQRLYNELNKFI
ncbi:MAG: Maf family nucleotide pyrophosphatase [Rikenellaceae bacterium]